MSLMKWAAHVHLLSGLSEHPISQAPESSLQLLQLTYNTTTPFVFNLSKFCCPFLNTLCQVLSACWNLISNPCCYIQAIKAPHTSWLESRLEHLVLCFHWQFSFPSQLHNDRMVLLIWFTQQNYIVPFTQNTAFQKPILYINLAYFTYIRSFIFQSSSLVTLLPWLFLLFAEDVHDLEGEALCTVALKKGGWELSHMHSIPKVPTNISCMGFVWMGAQIDSLGNMCR